MRTIPILLLVAVLAGCANTPEELHGLKPVTITVRDGDKPVDGILVTLHSKHVQSLRGCNGTTDSTGNAVIRTSVRGQSGNGAEPGEYKVLLLQSFVMPDDIAPGTSEDTLPEKTRVDLQAKRKAWMKANRIVPEIFETADKTPVELTIDEKSGTNLVIDISKHKNQTN